MIWIAWPLVVFIYGVVKGSDLGLFVGYMLNIQK